MWVLGMYLPSGSKYLPMRLTPVEFCIASFLKGSSLGRHLLIFDVDGVEVTVSVSLSCLSLCQDPKP